jgi:hypothetical protein
MRFNFWLLVARLEVKSVSKVVNQKSFSFVVVKGINLQCFLSKEIENFSCRIDSFQEQKMRETNVCPRLVIDYLCLDFNSLFLKQAFDVCTCLRR